MKKGFTLIELIAVIAILGLLILLVTPNMLKIINEKKEDIYNATVNEIEEQTRKYVVDNVDLYNEIDQDGYVEVELDTICKEKYIDCNVVDPRDKSKIEGYIRITNTNEVYNYSFIRTNGSENENGVIVTIDYNGGTGNQNFNRKYQKGETITLNNPTRAEYTFKGWKIIKGTATLENNVLTVGTSNITIYALWEKYADLVINLNGGTLNQQLEHRYISNTTITLENPTKTGYVFAGWRLDTGDSVLSGNTLVMGTIDTTITALWLKEYVITLNGNGATTNGSTTVTAVENSDKLGNIINPIKEYTITYNLNGTGATLSSSSDKATHIFKGWYTSMIAGAKVIDTNGNLINNVEGYTDSSGKWIRTSSAALYAQWEERSIQLATINKPLHTCYYSETSAGNKQFTSGQKDYIATSNKTLYVICVNTVNTYDAGEYNIFEAPVNGYYKVQLWGAGGNNNYNAYTSRNRSYGAYTEGYIYLQKGEKLYTYVGKTANTFNCCTQQGANAAGSGGATDVRYFGNYVPTADDLKWNSTLGLNSRIMVAAGGGATYADSSAPKGGNAGGLISQAVSGANAVYSTTQTAGGKGSTSGVAGSFGIGGTSSNAAYNSGAGGYYGGGGGPSGGGGTSFISGYAGVNAIKSSSDRTHTNNTLHYSNKYFIKTRMEVGVNDGDGKASITYIGDKPQRSDTRLNNVRYIKDCISGNNKNTNNTWVEIQAIKDGTNLVLGKEVVGTNPQSDANHAYSYITDGRIENTTGSSGYGYTASTGLQCITIDLGSTYDLDEIAVWHYFADGGWIFNNNITSVTNNGVNWIEVINKTEEETSNGKRVSAYDTEMYHDSDYQIYTVPKPGYYKIETWGAHGGKALCNNSACNVNTNGGYASGYIYLNKDEKLYLYIGEPGANAQKGKNSPGGYNGGGDGTWDNGDDESAGGGGGATDVRYFGSYTPTENDLRWNSELGLNSRIMVSAGGGGTSWSIATQGYGGGLVGGAGGVAGGNQSSSGNFGFGANGTGSGDSNGVAGGGGGYYGGNSSPSGTNNNASGGSSFISGYAGVNAITSSSNRSHTNNTKHYSGKYFINGTIKQNANASRGRINIDFVGEELQRLNEKLNNVRYIKDCINQNTDNSYNHWVEIQAIKDGINLAKGKIVTGTSDEDNNTTHSYTYITDGMIDNANDSGGFGQSKNGGLQCVTIDLGNTYDLDEIAVWHNYFINTNRIYNNNVTSVSSDNSNWIEIIKTSEIETSMGKRVSAYE